MIKAKMVLVFSAAIALVALVSNEAYAQKGKSSTAQGVMMDIQASGQFLIRGSETYVFDAKVNWLGDDNIDGLGVPTGESAPMHYYTNTAVNSPAPGGGGTITVEGVSVGYKTSGSGSAPSLTQITSNAVSPGVDPDKVAAHAESGNSQTGDWVVFADGGSSDDLTSSKYTRETEWQGTGLRKVTYTWTFMVAPIPNMEISPFTGWFLADGDNQGLAKVNINGIVAGESVLVKDGKTKYSFGLLNTDGTSRVSNVTVGVLVDGIWYASNAPGHVVVSGNDVDVDGNPIGDFDYFTNAGTNGTATTSLLNGDARTILNHDGFASNDNGGTGGTSLQHAVLDVSQFDLPAGLVLVTITGTVKGNAGAADISFSVSETINIIFRNP